MALKNRDHDSDPEQRPVPDWDSFEPYAGPEKKPLHPVLAFVVCILAPVALLACIFVAGGWVTLVLLAGGSHRGLGSVGTTPLQNWALDHAFAVFVAGGLISAGVSAYYMWRWWMRHRKR